MLMIHIPTAPVLLSSLMFLSGLLPGIQAGTEADSLLSVDVQVQGFGYRLKYGSSVFAQGAPLRVFSGDRWWNQSDGSLKEGDRLDFTGEDSIGPYSAISVSSVTCLSSPRENTCSLNGEVVWKAVHQTAAFSLWFVLFRLHGAFRLTRV